jgi:hypothetical protein
MFLFIIFFFLFLAGRAMRDVYLPLCLRGDGSVRGVARGAAEPAREGWPVVHAPVHRRGSDQGARLPIQALFFFFFFLTAR